MGLEQVVAEWEDAGGDLGGGEVSRTRLGAGSEMDASPGGESDGGLEDMSAAGQGGCKCQAPFVVCDSDNVCLVVVLPIWCQVSVA